MNVLRYFVRHPGCVDDLEGIARWRLAEQTIAGLVAETDLALEWLVARRLLVREATPGLVPRYRLNPARAADASVLVRGSEAKGPRRAAASPRRRRSKESS
jgi:hypothetical protein